MGRFVYRDYVPNVNTAERDESGWNELDFRALSAPQSQTLSEGVEMSSGCQITTTRPNNDRYYPIGNLDTAKGRYVTFYVESSADTEAALYMELGNLSTVNKFADWADLTVNGTKYTSDADMPAGTQYEASNTFVRIGYIPLREGQNAITFTVNNTASFTAHNIYGIKLLSPDATFTPAALPDPDDSEWTVYDFAAREGSDLAEGVSTTNGLKGGLGAPAHRKNDKEQIPIGDLNGNEGASVTFTVTADAATRAGLYLELSLRNTDVPFGGFLDLTVNGNPVTAADSVLLPRCQTVEEVFAPSNEMTYLCIIDLESGVNTITFTVSTNNESIGYNIYGIRLTSESAVISAGGNS